MRILILPFILLIGISASAQHISITGRVMDTSENKPLVNATVALIRKSDSVLLSFTRTKNDGVFFLKEKLTGNYQLLITYPAFADFSDILTPDQDNILDLGTIAMIRKSELLEAVIVRRQLAAIRIRGDTIAYMADSFAVRDGAPVEDLLRRLPGIQVDRNGQITAQGEKVTKLLVDGEEFFSDDPAVVIQNLGAATVDEVQVYDKKSDQAEFTGIDDGKRDKTINLKLKADRKKGYFGKAVIGGGTRETFDNSLMLNAFKGARKMSAYGIMSNTGKGSLDWGENERFGEGSNVEYDEENGYYYSMGGNDDFDQLMNTGQGLPTSWSGGLHYSDKWNEDRKKINMNYRILKGNMRSESSTISQYILPDTQYFNTRSENTFSSRMQNKLKGVYDFKFDSLSSLKISASGIVSRADNGSRLTNRSLNADSGLVNLNERLLLSHTEKDNFKANVLWRKKFNKKGRTLSLNVSQEASEERLEGSLVSGTDYFNESGNYLSENIDQKKNNSSSWQTLQTNAVYTEPLSKSTFLSFNYNFRYSLNNSSRNSYNKDQPNGEYNEKDSLLSNDFRFDYNTHTAGADFKLNKKKMTITVGSGIGYSSFNQTDKIRDSGSRYSFVNWFPKAVIKFTPAAQKFITFNYNGRTNAPALNQLQPVRENNDPLHIQVGNPGLRQEFLHNMSLWASSYKMLTQTNFYASVQTSVRQNAITSSATVDAGGKTTTRFINLNGNYSYNAFAGFNTVLKKIKLNVGGNISFNNGKNTSMVNDLVNSTIYGNYGVSLDVSKYVQDKYHAWIRPRLDYTRSKTSLRPDIVTRYFTTNTELGAWVKLPWKMELSANNNIQIRQKTNVFDRNLNTMKMDASLSRKFFKNNNGELKAGVYDIFNQNLGFNRNADSNVITENNYLILRRYWMLSFIYNISNTPK